VDVTITGAGRIEIFTAAQPMGQSLATTFTQLVVDVFGVSADRIDMRFGDTDRATGFGSAGSRSLFVVGSAVHVASERTLARAHDLAASALEAAAADIEYRDGVFAIGGTDRRIGLFELAERQANARIALQSTSAVDAASWPNGCHVCEVEVDPDTGFVALDRYWSVNDVGRVINPMVVTGQLEGGAAQGIGQALCEAFVYDAESGQALTASFSDYAMCRNIRTLFNFDPPATDEEIHAAALQFVRKLSGFNSPSKANEAAFARAIDDVAGAARGLVRSLVTNAAPRYREVEAERARARAAVRFRPQS